VDRVECWLWSSLWRRVGGKTKAKELLGRWPVDPPRDWVAAVNRPDRQEDLEAIRRCVVRGAPLGSPIWQTRTANRLGLQFTLRPRGRPRKPKGQL